MRALVTICGPNQKLWDLSHGDLIGRLRSAALPIDDPRVSEAHAMVSLRGESLRLLALRGRLLVNNESRLEVFLTEGLKIDLAPKVTIEVRRLLLPQTVMALEGDGLPRQLLQGVSSLVTVPNPRLVPGYLAQANAVFWGEDDIWKIEIAPGVTESLTPNQPFQIAGRMFRLVSVPLHQASSDATMGGLVPLRIVVLYDTVEIHHSGRVVLISGNSARLISELVDFGGPVSWEILAAEIWKEEVDREQLRSRFDMTVLRLRKRLRDCGIRDDLVTSTGTGHIHLMLREDDSIEDRN